MTCAHAIWEMDAASHADGLCPLCLQAELGEARDYIARSIASFRGDPPQNDFQRGFLAAMEVALKEAFP